MGDPGAVVAVGHLAKLVGPDLAEGDGIGGLVALDRHDVLGQGFVFAGNLGRVELTSHDMVAEDLRQPRLVGKKCVEVCLRDLGECLIRGGKDREWAFAL